MSSASQRPILVVGGGISGLTAALEAAEAGGEVLLVERAPAIGGRVLRNHKYFPKLCPPACGMEVNIGRLERNPRIRLLANTEVTAASRGSDGWTVTLTSAPEYVNERCTTCHDCSKACPVRLPDPDDLRAESNGNTLPAIRLAGAEAAPRRYFIERSACPPDCRACVEVCKYDAIDLNAAPREETVEVASVVLATGWTPYPLGNLSELGGGRLPNVIANVNMERMASATGPTGGQILRPSDGEAPKRVAFVQCAGSRDVKHLAYCSAICCLASLKQATYVRNALPEAEVTIYYIDRRTPGRNEEMLTEVAAMEGIRLVKGKVGRIEEGPGGGLDLRVEEIEEGRLRQEEADLVVLATGMVPASRDDRLPFGVQLDPDGFALDQPDTGVFVAGVTRRPEDVASSVRDATGAAAKALAAAERSV